MKTTKILGATTLAGALLFTGVNTNDANAKQDLPLANEKEWQIKHDRLLESRLSGQGGEGGGPGAVSSYQDSYQEYVNYYKDWAKKNGYDISIRSEKESAELFKDDETVDFDNYQLPNNQNQTNNTTATQNNDQQTQAANDNTTATQNNDQQTQAANDNTTATQNNDQQTQSKQLPETGEESSNTTLVTMIASVILAAGSLLAFRRTSKSNK